MTVEYIARRIYKKARLIHDVDIFAFKKLGSAYPIILVTILGMDILLVINKLFGFAAVIVEYSSKNEIIFFNIFLIYVTYRAWKNKNRVKYEFVEFQLYISDLKEYSYDTLRKLVIQINKRKRGMENMVWAMTEFQIIIPGSFILTLVFKLFEVIKKGEVELDIDYIFFISVALALQIGFMLGSRKNVTSFKVMQNSVFFKIRNLIVDSLVISKINPGSNAIRRPNK